ncbi:MAG: DNA polymerase III subunit chi [Candidatus Brocadiaceae bacterium]|jgi:DNA polymerase-3 subunit chi
MEKEAQKVAQFIELRTPQDRLGLVCRWAERCYERGETVSIHLPDPDDARELDRALWTFRQQCFIPHVRLEEAREPLIEPVVIFSDGPGDLLSDVLFLAGAVEMPAWFTEFPRLYDLAPVYDQELRQAARERYAACQEAGYRMRFIRP